MKGGNKFLRDAVGAEVWGKENIGIGTEVQNAPPLPPVFFVRVNTENTPCTQKSGVKIYRKRPEGRWGASSVFTDNVKREPPHRDPSGLLKGHPVLVTSIPYSAPQKIRPQYELGVARAVATKMTSTDTHGVKRQPEINQNM